MARFGPGLETNDQNTKDQKLMKTILNPGSTGNRAQNVTEKNEMPVPPPPARRNRLAWSLGIFLTVALALLFARDAKSNDNLQSNGHGLEGSWINTVSPILPPGAPPVSFQTYVTFMAGGTSIGSDRTRPFASPQYGTWVQVQRHEYAATFVQDIFDPAGNFLGTFKGRMRARLVGKNEFVGVANIEQRDPNGNVVFNRCARFRGVRIAVEPLAPPCDGLSPGM